MPDTVILAQVALAHDNGLPEDAVVNTFHFGATNAIDVDDLGEITVAVAAFYHVFDENLSEELSGAGTISYYNLAHPKPRAPLLVSNIVLTPSVSNTALPSQACVVLSYQGVRQSGIPQARRRGRLFLGPWSGGAGTGSPLVVSGGLRTQLQTAAVALSNFVSVGGASAHWVVYSPTIRESGGTFDQAAIGVANGWIDDSFDVQRRRQRATTTRTLWTRP